MSERHLIFHGFESTGWLVLAVTACVVAFLLIVVLLRYELQLVRRRVGGLLLALRLSIIVVVFATLMEPVLSWTLGRQQTARILVAVDVSDSMNSTDTHAGRSEKLRWARALGMIGNPSIDKRLDGWIESLEAGREPEWVDEEESSDPEARRQLAEVRKTNLHGVFAALDRLTRKDMADRLLTQTASPLLPRLNGVGHVELRVFAGKAEAVDESTLVRALGEPSESLVTGVSDVSQALAASSGDPKSSPLVGLVLLSDGRDNSERDPIGAATRLKLLSTPVFTVLLGSDLQPKDLAIAAIDHPQTVFKDDRPLLKATINTAGFEGEAVTVVLERAMQKQDGAKQPGKPTDGTQTKTITPSGSAESVEFTLDAEKVGRHRYTLRVDVRPEETRDDNNQQSFAVNVVDDSAQVLLLEGAARWEFRFLDNALTRDEHVTVERVVFRQPYLGVLPAPFFPRRLVVPAGADHSDRSPFAEFDVVIVGDVAPSDLPRSTWALLERFVAESGGTLVLSAGKGYLPLAYRSEVLERLIPLTELRPVSVTGTPGTDAPTRRGFQLQLTPEGENEPMLQFDADRDENERVWSRLPGHLWGVLGQAKPGATVLASTAGPVRETSLKAERQSPVIVHQHYGAGQVLWLGIDSTWRWRHRVGDTYHHRFWGQLARWAAQNKTAAGNEFVKFGPERTDIDMGTDAVVRARWTQGFLSRYPSFKARAEVIRVDEGDGTRPFATLELKPEKTRPLVYEGRLVSLPPGEYRLKLVADGAELGEKEISAMLYVHEPKTPELSNLTANRQLLMQVAEVSGGQFLLPDEVGRIPDLIRKPTESASVRNEIALWDHWLVLAALFGLLTTEWIVRKLNGLP